ncbi:phage head-tail connector protein [Butyricicoccus sp.]|uniref:phage head-tail connector protein n=1 Tax=Butyricicoccus sp. TaxID=2049021 RepID=UPI003D7E1C2B
MTERIRSNVKTLLGVEDDVQDEMLDTIVQSVQSRLRVLLGGVDTIPEQLAYIVAEVAVIRYNRIGSEGMSSHTVEGESISYADNDFSGFMPDIEAWQEEQEKAKRGRVRFL